MVQKSDEILVMGQKPALGVLEETLYDELLELQ
jgi:hypothetical protein